MGPIIVETTVRLGYAIFAVAGLTFLGFGVQPPSPDWSLQIADNYTLLNAGTVLVDGALPGARDRHADRRRQPDRRRPPAGVRPMSETAPVAAPHALELDDARRRLSRPRTRPRRCCAASRSRSRRGDRVRARRRVRLRQVDRGARDRPVPAAQRPRDASGDIQIAGRDVLTRSRADAPARCARTTSRWSTRTRAGAEPVDPDRQAGRRGLHACAARRRQRRASASRDALALVQIADPGVGDAALPASALRRHAAARRDRDGARQGSRAPDPRRADDGPRRDRRGGGARPRRRAAGEAPTRRCSSSATTSA